MAFSYRFIISAFNWYSVGYLIGIFADNDSSESSVYFSPKRICDAIFNVNYQ